MNRTGDPARNGYPESVFEFETMLRQSKEAPRQASHKATLRRIFPLALEIEKTPVAVDRTGTDYVVRLRRGAIIRVDSKDREAGCSRFWRRTTDQVPIPEVGLELWSVMPCERIKDGIVGWALDESKEVDLILFSWDSLDHKTAYVRAFPLLREAFRRNYSQWKRVYHSTQPQPSVAGDRSWFSQCLFVPLPVLDEAMRQVAEVTP